MSKEPANNTGADQAKPLSLNPDRVRLRYRAEARFRAYGIIAIAVALGALVWLLASVALEGSSAFTQTSIELDIYFDPEIIDPDGKRDPDLLREANYSVLYKRALYQLFPDVSGRRDKRQLAKLVSSGSDLALMKIVMAQPDIIGARQKIWLTASDDIDMLNKGYIDRQLPQTSRPVSDRHIVWFDQLTGAGLVKRSFNIAFFSHGDSREPEQAGIWGAVVGSFFTMAVTLLLSFPIGVAAATYLEEFAPKNRWTDLIEVNLNNLAAVPSIVFGLLGVVVFLNVMGLPRSAPLVGGMVLALMTLPTIIIATRATLRAVPPSIREAALGIGASRFQVVTHHVLPLALPGTLTGTIIGMGRALGETAPLLLIGMVAFIVDIPESATDAATVLPVQIFLWSDMPERAFVERTSAAIMVLLGFLILMNLIAIVLRKKFERRW